MLKGSTVKLRALVRGFKKLAKPEARAGATKLMAAEALSRVLDCFDKSRNPYGQKWKPIKYREGKPLLDTGRLRNSLHAKSSVEGFRVTTNVEYAAIHNYGGKVSRRLRGKQSKMKRVTIPQRQFVPDAERLPQSWARALKAVANRSVKRLVGAG